MVKASITTVTEAAKLLGITTRQMRRIASTIPGAFRIGSGYILPLREVMKLKNQRDKAQKKRAQDSSES